MENLQTPIHSINVSTLTAEEDSSISSDQNSVCRNCQGGCELLAGENICRYGVKKIDRVKVE